MRNTSSVSRVSAALLIAVISICASVHVQGASAARREETRDLETSTGLQSDEDVPALRKRLNQVEAEEAKIQQVATAQQTALQALLSQQQSMISEQETLIKQQQHLETRETKEMASLRAHKHRQGNVAHDTPEDSEDEDSESEEEETTTSQAPSSKCGGDDQPPCGDFWKVLTFDYSQSIFVGILFWLVGLIGFVVSIYVLYYVIRAAAWIIFAVQCACCLGCIGIIVFVAMAADEAHSKVSF